MSSYEDPDFSSKTYKSVIIDSDFDSLEFKRYVESRVCRELAGYDLRCQRAIDVFPPTRKFTVTEWDKKFKKSGADSIIAIQLTDSYSANVYVPQTSYSSGSVNTIGNTSFFNQTTNSFGGYNTSKEIHEYKVLLVDGKTRRNAFIATSKSSGHSQTNAKELATSLAKELVERLDEYGLIVKLPKD